ncbi:hypothetical protein ACFQH8_17100 [Halomicroarcula sp. GCM10025710]
MLLSVLGIVGSLLAGQYGWVRLLRPFVLPGMLFQPLGLSPARWCLWVGLATLVAFGRWEMRQHRAGRPVLVPPSTRRNRTFRVGTVTFASIASNGRPASRLPILTRRSGAVRSSQSTAFVHPVPNIQSGVTFCVIGPLHN